MEEIRRLVYLPTSGTHRLANLPMIRRQLLSPGVAFSERAALLRPSLSYSRLLSQLSAYLSGTYFDPPCTIRAVSNLIANCKIQPYPVYALPAWNAEVLAAAEVRRR